MRVNKLDLQGAKKKIEKKKIHEIVKFGTAFRPLLN